MCGIVGFIGHHDAAPILLESLAKLEYRGYDSAGVAVRDGNNPAIVIKAQGRLSNLVEKTDGGHAVAGNCGIVLNTSLASLPPSECIPLVFCVH